jgi:protein-S-isoprenylcysteine O-methyltransferase
MLPPYSIAAALILMLYMLQSEIRFGAKARAIVAGTSDRGSTIVVTIGSMVPVVGFIFAMQGKIPMMLPWMPAAAWAGIILGAFGLILRLWAVLMLRDLYTRTLLVQERQHLISRHGPYRFVRHPGYLGSLLCLNGIGLASGNTLVAVASIVITGVAYAYRIRVEDAMLVGVFGESYVEYRRNTTALFPRFTRKESVRIDQ